MSMPASDGALPRITICTDPNEVAAAYARRVVAERNLDWLQEHIFELADGNIGRWVCIAEQQAYFADDQNEAFRLASAAHPGAMGLIEYYFFPPQRPLTHASRRSVA